MKDVSHDLPDNFHSYDLKILKDKIKNFDFKGLQYGYSCHESLTKFYTNCIFVYLIQKIKTEKIDKYNKLFNWFENTFTKPSGFSNFNHDEYNFFIKEFENDNILSKLLINSRKVAISNLYSNQVIEIVEFAKSIQIEMSDNIMPIVNKKQNFVFDKRVLISSLAILDQEISPIFSVIKETVKNTNNIKSIFDKLIIIYCSNKIEENGKKKKSYENYLDYYINSIYEKKINEINISIMPEEKLIINQDTAFESLPLLDREDSSWFIKICDENLDSVKNIFSKLIILYLDEAIRRSKDDKTSRIYADYRDYYVETIYKNNIRDIDRSIFDDKNNPVYKTDKKIFDVLNIVYQIILSSQKVTILSSRTKNWYWLAAKELYQSLKFKHDNIENNIENTVSKCNDYLSNMKWDSPDIDINKYGLMHFRFLYEAIIIVYTDNYIKNSSSEDAKILYREFLKYFIENIQCKNISEINLREYNNHIDSSMSANFIYFNKILEEIFIKMMGIHSPQPINKVDLWKTVDDTFHNINFSDYYLGKRLEKITSKSVEVYETFIQKGDTMATNTSTMKSKAKALVTRVAGVVKSDTLNAGKRTLANQFFKTAKVPMQEILRKNLDKIPNESIKSIITYLLESDVGESILKISMGTFMPHLSINVTQEMVSMVSEELRVQGYQGLFDKVTNTMIDPLREIIRDSFSISIPKVYPELVEATKPISFEEAAEAVKVKRK